MEYWIMESVNSSVLQDGETKNLQLQGFSPFVLWAKAGFIIVFHPRPKGQGNFKIWIIYNI